ncbi:unnamed protein product (macronuclear) [Paramecium tetraurelia]|uniref:Uncharacterized protein n=1 Tax=Paramecium tetraurelia TaxID=5888 RepID=A0C166_PARTE|nr:uncharacterized protein GSPATT00034009001 [Paramecium tetraurelia]CAK64533.1 unnamed protein product [Paramecium tetraurelia]|eukprot:XP_001431931.1 hypothetical protein (macronuclear) [Paramecium tetraurelia strain d4-2]
MLKQQTQLNTPSTQFTARTPEKNMAIKPPQIQSDIYNYTPHESRGIILLPYQQNYQLPGTLIPQQDVQADIQSPARGYEINSLANISDNIKHITQNLEELQVELKQEKQKRLDIENKFEQLQQQNQELEQELNKQKQICKQMEYFSKELESKLQNQVTITSSHSSVENENQQNIFRQVETQMIELKKQLEQEKLKSSNESDKLIKEFKIIYQEQKNLNQKLLDDNTQLQKAIRSIEKSSKKAQKQSSNLLEEAKLRKIVELFYFDNNEECLIQIPTEQQLEAIKILKQISQSQNSKTQKDQTDKKWSAKKELKNQQEQLIGEIKGQMGKFIDQKNIQQKDVIKLQKESAELIRQLDQVESYKQEIEQSSKHNSHKNSNVSFKNNNFY